MSLEVFLAFAAIIVAVLIYFAGVQRGTKQERDRQTREEMLEHNRREQNLASKVADEYVDMVRRRFDSGVHALARLGLHRLGSDQLIRQAIHEMEVRTGQDPWGQQSALLQDIDLVVFFQLVSEQKINFFETSLEQHIETARANQGNQDATKLKR